MARNKALSFTARSLHPQWTYRQLKKIVVVRHTMVQMIKGNRVDRNGPYVMWDIEEATCEQTLQ